MSNKIAKGLCKAFKGTVFTKTGRCVKKMPQHFIEGVSIERTPYKETFYVWSFTNPIWVKRPLDTLGYSKRIAHGRYFSGNAEQITKEVIAELNNNALHLSRVSEPETTAQQFIDAMFSIIPQAHEHYSKLHGNERAFDYGVCLALADRLEDSRTILEAFLTFAHRSQHYLRLCASAIVTSLRAGDQTYLEVISDMEEQSKSHIPYELREQVSAPSKAH